MIPIERVRVLNNQVLIKLFKKEIKVTNSGLITPDFEHYETDGGKLGMKPIFEKWEAYGKAISSSTNSIPQDSMCYFKNNVKLEIIDDEEGYAIINELQISYIVLPESSK